VAFSREIVVDTSALVAISLFEPERERFVDIIANSRWAFVSVASVLESRIVLRRDHSERGAMVFEEVIATSPIQMVSVEAVHLEIAHRAFLIYGKGQGHKAQLNFGDLFSYSLAKHRNMPLLYKGNDFSATDIAPVV
jgi:ribonuclease VapC